MVRTWELPGKAVKGGANSNVQRLRATTWREQLLLASEVHVREAADENRRPGKGTGESTLTLLRVPDAPYRFRGTPT